MDKVLVTISAFWDSEAAVWVASSNDVPGLVTEASTIEDLTKKLRVMIPELMQLNRSADFESTNTIDFDLTGNLRDSIQVSC